MMMCLLAASGIKAVDYSGETDAKLALKTAELTIAEASRFTLKTQRAVALLTLQGFEKASGLAIDGLIAVAKAAATSTITIDSMKAHAALGDLIGGKLPKVSLAVTVFGKKQELKDLSFDMKNPQKSVVEVVTKLLGLVNVFDF